MESGSMSGDAGGIDLAVMVGNNFFTDGETDAGAGKLGFTMQPLEDPENMFSVLGFETDTVVADPEIVVMTLPFAGNGNEGGHSGVGVLERIGKEVAEQLGHLQGDALDKGEIVKLQLGALL